ncbi:MAG TPA: hypothetical protein VEK33_17180 [Terriglobales bacterium]|nr:hypothetical protein [Terriglobales bacterium]
MPITRTLTPPRNGCRSDLEGSLKKFFHPSLTEHERNAAEIEGWILGIA